MSLDRLGLAIALFLTAGVLLGSGAAKLRRPEGTSRALAALGLPSRFWLVRLFGSAEVTVGSACLLAPVRPAAAGLGALYLAFAGFLVLVMLRGDEGAGCGCFGDQDSPPSSLHLAFDFGAVVTAGLAAVWPVPGLPELIRTLPFDGFSFVVGIAAASYLAIAALRFLPQIGHAGSTQASRG